MTAIFAPIRMIEDQLAALVARNGIFSGDPGDPGAPILSAATRRNGVPSLMPGLAAVTPPGGHRAPRPSLPLRRLRHRDRSRLPGRRDRPGPVRATHHRLGELPAVRPVRSREALGRGSRRSPVRRRPHRSRGGWPFLFAVSISTATITAMGRRTARRFEPFLARVADVIRTAVPVKHLDETGLRIAARTRWLHVLCTPFLTVLRIGAGRGDVEKDLEGILIHDDYAAYFTLKGVRHGAQRSRSSTSTKPACGSPPVPAGSTCCAPHS